MKSTPPSAYVGKAEVQSVVMLELVLLPIVFGKGCASKFARTLILRGRQTMKIRHILHQDPMHQVRAFRGQGEVECGGIEVDRSGRNM